MIAYRVHCAVSGKAYIGITTRPLATRWRQHVEAAKYGRKTRIAAAIRKYGVPTFSVEHIASARSVDELAALERLLIEQEDTFRRGYNSTLGGPGVPGLTPNEETRWKIGSANRGKKQSPERVERRAAALRGRKGWSPTLEQRRIASEVRLGKYQHTEEHKAHMKRIMTGRVFTDEWRANISAAKKGNNDFATPDWRAAVSARQRGVPKPPRTAEHCANLSAARKAAWQRSRDNA